MLSAVEYIHGQNIAHRDIKLENILMIDDDLVKICDFGLSNYMKDGELLTTLCGSLNYCSPEIIKDQPYEGTSLDVWSLGVCLFYLLAKEYPFEAELNSQVSKKIVGNYRNMQKVITKFLRA